MSSLQPPLPSLDTPYRGMNREMHLRWMATQPVAQQLPSETLRDQIDGPDMAPQRRQFARRVDLYERELRLPAPGVSWLQLQRGHAAPIMNGLPSMQQRVDRRAYNQYCEPSKDLQPAWDQESERIRILIRRIRVQKRVEFATAYLVGVTVGVGGLNVLLASLLGTPVGWPVMVGWIAACMLSIAWHLHARSERIRF